MKRVAWALSLAVLTIAGAAPAAEERPRLTDYTALQEAVAEAIKQAEPSIVCVLVSRTEDPPRPRPFDGASGPRGIDDPEQVPEAYGSGVVIDEKGLILTNLHVVRDAKRIFLRFPGGKGSDAEVFAGDPRSDLAVLRVLDPRLLPLKAIKIGDGARVRKGDFVVSLANPFAAGFRDGSPSASWGIISNIRRPRLPAKPTDESSYKTLQQFGTLLQTDARLNLGCSGGALLDLHGELIGLTTSLAAISGGETPGGFAIPLDNGLRRIIDVLERGEEVEYGFLGISFPRQAVQRPDPGDPGAPGGVQIQGVVAGSPAAQAHLFGGTGGDYILKVNGIPVHERDDLFLALGTLLAGSTAQLEVFHPRTNRTETISVTLAKFYVPGKLIAAKRHPPKAIGGLRVDYTSILYLRPGGAQVYLRGIPRGVMIREVEAGSAADTARLQEAKVIARVNGRDVNTPDEFYREMQKADSPVELTLLSPDLREEKVKIDIKPGG